jgi:ubiquinone/menaquinone biosynthesis C-methylase UbiE
MQFDPATMLWRRVELGLLKKKWSRYFNGKILDLGCGEGEIAKDVFDKQIDWGLDNDPEMIKKAKKSKVYKKVLLASAIDIPLKDNTVDLVFSNSVLEHIPNITQVLKEVKRVLKPSGELIITMPSHQLSNYLGLGELYGKLFNHKYCHYHLYSLPSWKKLLLKHNLKVIDSYYYLDKETIGKWHKLLWLNKLGIKTKSAPITPKILKMGAGITIRAKKI